jgi:trigger factor
VAAFSSAPLTGSDPSHNAPEFHAAAFARVSVKEGSMKVQVEDLSPIEKRLSIEVEPALVEKELASAYQQLGKQVKVPGFRPGKVPRRILEQQFRREVEADVIKRVQLIGFFDALKETKVAAVSDPSFSGGTIEPQKPFSYTARVEVKPPVEARDYKGLTLPKFDAAVPEDRVTEQLERLRTSRTEVVTVAGRDVAQKGDFVVIDFDATIDGKPFTGGTSRDVTVEVAEGELINGNLPQLEGVKVGAVKELDYTFPAEYRLDEMKGKTARFAITVKELKEKKVPELDDAFARLMGEETAEALRARVRRDLERTAKSRAEVDEREAVFKALVEKNPLEVPQAMVNRGIDLMLEGALGSLARSGMDPRMLQLDWGKLRDELRPKAALEVRGQLLLEAIARAEKVEATDADVEAKIAELGGATPQLQAHYRSPEARESLKSRVVEEKVIALIKQHAKFE